MADPRYFIAGPCAIESVDSFVSFADDLVRLFEDFPKFRLVYKGSFDKANRTREGSPRGVGLVDAEVAWQMIRANHPRLMMTTDVHETWQCRPASYYCDVLQIPAFLGRQTDLLHAAAQTGRIVNVKKPQWESVWYMDSVASKCQGAKDFWFTYRGTSYGQKLVLDLNEIIDLCWEQDNSKTFVDLTHTNRKDREQSTLVAQACAAVGIRNYFAETHPNPDEAICDADNQLPLQELQLLLMSLNAGSV